MRCSSANAGAGAGETAGGRTTRRCPRRAPSSGGYAGRASQLRADRGEPGEAHPKSPSGQRRYGGAVGCAYFGRTARRTRVGQEHPSSSSLVGLVRRDSGGGGDDTNKSKTAVQSGARSHFVRRGAGGHAITQRFMHCGGAVVRAYSGKTARRTRAARSGSSSRGAFLSGDGDKPH